MNRTVAGWRTWFIVKMPNIGVMLCRGNDRVRSTFEAAWVDYQVSAAAYAQLLVARSC